MRVTHQIVQRSTVVIPPDLRSRLETARLDLLALFRSLDRMDLSAREIPQRLLQQLFELDADHAEALWVLDQPRATFDLRLMMRDTLSALEQFPAACARFRTNLPQLARPILASLEPQIRNSLDPREAYNLLPGTDPQSS